MILEWLKLRIPVKSAVRVRVLAQALMIAKALTELTAT